MPVHHLTLAVRSRLNLVRNELERRELLRNVVEALGREGLLFSLVDDHLHSLISSDQPGYRGRSLRRLISNRRPDLDLKPVHTELVARRSYLNYLVRYLLEQPAKHGLSGHPALWTGSCFQDLVGARLLSGFDRTSLLTELPRFRLRDAFRVVGLKALPLTPANDEALRRAGAARIADLAAGVFAADPALAGRSREVVRARTLAEASASSSRSQPLSWRGISAFNPAPCGRSRGARSRTRGRRRSGSGWRSSSARPRSAGAHSSSGRRRGSSRP